MKYLIPLNKEGSIHFTSNVFSFSVGQATNSFLLFIRLRSGSVLNYNIGEIHDIINISQRWSNKARPNCGHFIHHLVLTSIWNLTLAKPKGISNTYNYPTFDEVLESLSWLKYTKKQVLRALFALYDGSSARPGLVEIQSQKHQHIFREKDMSDDDLVNITLRGKVVVAALSNTLSYIYGCSLLLDQKRNGNAPQFQEPKSFNLSNAIEHFFPYICDVAQMCTEFLIRIRDDCDQFNDENWFNDLLLHFGIPITKEFSYAHQQNIGQYIYNQKRSLQFNMMLNSIIALGDSRGQKSQEAQNSLSKIKRLEQKYNEKVKKIIEGKGLDDFNYRQYFGINRD